MSECQFSALASRNAERQEYMRPPRSRAWSQAVPGRYRRSGHLNEFEEHLGSLLHAAWLLMAVVDRLPQDLRDVERQADIEIATMISEGIFISARSVADREFEIAHRLVGAQRGDAARFDRQ